ncbi:hypothetical protein D1007_09437 [Hordeum vulgare]|nr:hypothetical protein D1007_09437 [Hordeum vulgare]
MHNVCAINLCVHYNSGDDVEDGNKESFIEKEAQKIREKGKAAYFKRGMFRCPYCTTKPKPRDGVYEHLMSHARGLSRSADQDIKTRAEHAAILKALDEDHQVFDVSSEEERDRSPTLNPAFGGGRFWANGMAGDVDDEMLSPQEKVRGFPRLGVGRVARVPRLMTESMSGKGAPLAVPPLAKAPAVKPPSQSMASKQQALQPGKVTAQGSRAPALVAKSMLNQQSAGGTVGDEANRMQPRGRWGDNGVNAYGHGHHRGSSSSGGGRGKPRPPLPPSEDLAPREPNVVQAKGQSMAPRDEQLPANGGVAELADQMLVKGSCSGGRKPGRDSAFS